MTKCNLLRTKSRVTQIINPLRIENLNHYQSGLQAGLATAGRASSTKLTADRESLKPSMMLEGPTGSRRFCPASPDRWHVAFLRPLHPVLLQRPCLLVSPLVMFCKIWNMQNRAHSCRFKTLTFQLQRRKHFKRDLLQDYQLSHRSAASLMWWHVWVKKHIAHFLHSPAWCLCFQRWCWTHSGPSSSRWGSRRCVSFGGCSLPGYGTAPPLKPRGVSVCAQRRKGRREKTMIKRRENSGRHDATKGIMRGKTA